jgi:two-component system chemotaxis response regulator CheB
VSLTAQRRTRILIVDDSVVMRTLLRSVIGTDISLEVAGTAANGESALGAFENLRPDLVLLGVEMPVMDGLATLRELQARGHRAPVIMCSSLTQRGARVTIEGLACGASDYVAKPAGQDGRDAAVRALARDLIPKIKALTARPANGQPLTTAANGRRLAPPPTVVAIGVSTGGPAALEAVLPTLPYGFPLPVLVVQHMPDLFTAQLAERLKGPCRLPVREAAEGSAVEAGTITIARGNWHLEVLGAAQRPASATLHLTQGAPENHCRPSVDMLFRSAAEVYGGGVLAVVLTGMGSDGVAGCRALRRAGSTVVVQDQATSAVYAAEGGRSKPSRGGDARRSRNRRPGRSSASAGSDRTGDSAPCRPRPGGKPDLPGAGGVAMQTGSAHDYRYLREVVAVRSQNVLDPSCDHLFDVRLARLLRNLGMNGVKELV